MADSHPYISGPGNIAQMVMQLRNAFPPVVTSDTVKRLGLASNNESYVINALQFVAVLDSDGKKTEKAAEVFSHHKDEEFSKSFRDLVSNAYSDLFDLHGEKAWTLDDDALITFFRRADQTSVTIGKRQAGTFKIFSALSGFGEIPTPRGQKSKEKNGAKTKTAPKKQPSKSSTEAVDYKSISSENNSSSKKVNRDFGLSVRIEINLPADGSRETYDNIFKSIKENLLNE
ncbi:hypothetical protein SAMN05216369_1281 [Marinobacter antarcticus]|uniref:DUF5343 domain-containing protein n=1 Tax=Marinobacter antarcticus TaxID=564117 RepID=A0A1M6R365_9GAMM|nr:DUF5343 domain-containing protein [Marinobacter antarcticus]SHK26840.1 hypothetical protein SAMN05216369_1281 [Marinobacter antarcticus]